METPLFRLRFYRARGVAAFLRGLRVLGMKKYGWLLVAFWLGAAPALSAQSQITIVVFDYARLPHEVITSAVEEGKGILRTAGIEAQWIVCDFAGDRSDGCSEPLPMAARYLSMLLLQTRPSGMDRFGHGDTAGLALVGDNALGQPRGWLFYDAVERVAAETHRKTPSVMGCVLVHEIAHVLGLKHGRNGVMRTNLYQRRPDEARLGWAFTTREAAQLRAGVVRLNQYWGIEPLHVAASLR